MLLRAGGHSITVVALGILEHYGNRKFLLHYLIQEIHEKDGTASVEKEDPNKMERRLVAAGETIRELALKRKGVVEGEEGEPRSGAGRRKRRCRVSENARSNEYITFSMLAQADGMGELDGAHCSGK